MANTFHWGIETFRKTEKSLSVSQPLIQQCYETWSGCFIHVFNVLLCNDKRNMQAG